MKRLRTVGCITSASAIVLSCMGCGEELPPILAEGDRVRLAPLGDVRVCGGTVNRFERYLHEAEARLGVERPEPLTIYWGADAAIRFCENPRFRACAAPADGDIFSDLIGAPHEIIHHVAHARASDTNSLFEEGIAVHLAGECVRVETWSDDYPASLADLAGMSEATDAHYVAGGSFVNFVVSGWGLDAALRLRDVVRPETESTTLDQDVRATLGVSLAELDERWRTTSPFEVCGPRFPTSSVLPEVYSFQPTTVVADLECANANTEGPIDRSFVYGESLSAGPLEPGMYEHSRLVVPSLADVRLELEGPLGTSAVLYSRECWDPSAVAAENDGVIEISPEEPVVLTLGACVWQVFLLSN